MEQIVSRNQITEKVHGFSRTMPGKPAVIFHRHFSISYGQLSDLYEQIATYLDAFNIKSWNRVANISSDALGYAILEAPLMENAIYIPIDPSMNSEKLKEYLEMLKVDFVITDIPDQELLQTANLLNIGVLHYSLKDISGYFELKIERSNPYKGRTSNEASCNDISLLVTTSGTTRKPKIVPLSYSKLMESIFINERHYNFNDKSTTLLIVPKHSYLFITNLNVTLMMGGTVVLLDHFNSRDVYESVNMYPVTWFTAAPTILSSFRDYLNSFDLKLNSKTLEFIRTTGAPLTKKAKDDFEEAFNVQIIQLYGMTEVAGITSTLNPPKGFKEESAGVAFGLDIKIHDYEILVKGPTVFDGYENDEEVNKESFLDGWFRTGDMGFIDEDGYLFITGRVKELINKGGEKVSPYEIESLILKHPDVVNTAVFPYTTNLESEDIGAVVELIENAKMDLNILRKFLESKIGFYKMPTRLYIALKIPVGVNNKIQRNNLFEELERGYDLVKVYDLQENNPEPGIFNHFVTPIESKILNIWKKTLNFRDIGLADDFFIIGGDSLAAVSVLSEIETVFNIQMPISILFEGRTIKALAEYIESGNKSKKQLRYLLPIKTTGSKSLVVCLHTGDGEAVTYHSIGKYLGEDRPVYAFRFNMDKGEWNHPLSFNEICERYADELISICPEGPYNLLGGCYGGVLALKLASTLQHRGKRVLSVTMIDSPWVSTFNNMQQVEAIGGLKGKLTNSVAKLKTLNMSETIPYILKKVSSFIKLNKENFGFVIYKIGVRTGNESLARVVGKRAALKWAILKYKPDRYIGKVYYYKAAMEIDVNSGRVEKWQSLINDLQVIDINAFHNDMQNNENSRIIADSLNNNLSRSST